MPAQYAHQVFEEGLLRVPDKKHRRSGPRECTMGEKMGACALVTFFAVSILFCFGILTIGTIESLCVDAIEEKYSIPVCKILNNPEPLITYTYEGRTYAFAELNITARVHHQTTSSTFVEILLENHPVTEEQIDHVFASRYYNGRIMIVPANRRVSTGYWCNGLQRIRKDAPCYALAIDHELIPKVPQEYFDEKAACHRWF